MVNSMIKTIIFDLGGVLFTNGTKKFIQDVSTKYGVPAKVVGDVMDGEIGSRYREAKISRDEFWKLALEKLNISENVDVLEAQWIGGYELIKGTADIIFKLKEKYKVHYLSDNVKERVTAIDKKFHFMEWFDGGVYSHDVGVRKPDPKIYQVVLEKAGAKPEETVFIDDKAPALVPAEAMGIKTILFVSPEDLEIQLKNIGVLD